MLRAEQGRQIRSRHDDGHQLLAADGVPFADRGGMGVRVSSRRRHEVLLWRVGRIVAQVRLVLEERTEQVMAGGKPEAK